MRFEESDVLTKIKGLIIQRTRDTNSISDKKYLSYHSVKFFDIGCLRIRVGPKVKYLCVPVALSRQLKAASIDMSKHQIRDGWYLIYFNTLDDINSVAELILELYNYCEYKKSDEMFGCCSKYNECSDKLTCVQREKPWHRGCFYRLKLAEGKIFYGTNKTI